MSNVSATHPAGIKPLGYQQITVSTTAVALTVPANAVRAVLVVEDQPLRWRDDGTDPTASAGFLVKADVVFELHGTLSLNAFKAIRDDSSDAVLSVSYYG